MFFYKIHRFDSKNKRSLSRRLQRNLYRLITGSVTVKCPSKILKLLTQRRLLHYLLGHYFSILALRMWVEKKKHRNLFNEVERHGVRRIKGLCFFNLIY